MENNHKSGFIAVMGRPNVGKSTLLNRLLQQTIAAVSPKPQTTRLQQLGILTLPEGQLIFIDTPGLHFPKHKLGEFMNQDALQALKDADLALLILDGSAPPNQEDQIFREALRELKLKNFWTGPHNTRFCYRTLRSFRYPPQLAITWINWRA